jgi:mono/diheme cytochrome c family protein
MFLVWTFRLFQPFVCRLAFIGALFLLGAGELRANEASAPNFARDIFPILRRHCFECHGAKKQEADLRLDQRRAALGHAAAIVPGDSAHSEVYRRTTLQPGDDEIMPAVGKPLTKREIELLRRWIDAGATWLENV